MMIKCDFCGDYKDENVMNLVDEDFFTGSDDRTKKWDLCDNCLNESMERRQRIEHAQKHGRSIDIWEAENVE